jgi:hypothetical protein
LCRRRRKGAIANAMEAMVNAGEIAGAATLV